ncbi:MAG: hypothetical protein ACKV2O_22450 [Acidimicrobiales bacterium]
MAITRSRRLGAAALATAALSGAMAAPAAAHDNDDERGGRGGNKTVEVARIDVSWTMSSASCSQLPPGTTISGTGVLRDKMTTTTRNGLITVAFDSVAKGRATDQAGNVYRWHYDNESSATNSTADPLIYRGWMTDTFELDGKGPVEVEAGFEADIVEDRVAGTFAINERSSFGDPLTFGSPYFNRCDPL